MGKEAAVASFTREVANEWYADRYSTHVPLDQNAVSWFPNLPNPSTPFDLAAIRPRDIRAVLSRKRSTSAPGEDSILNGHLKHLESTHHFLATLFSKTLLTSPEPWEGWGSSVISLIHKAGETSDPVNFRPIALTSCVGKLFHQVMASRISSFLISNGYLDVKTQKAFMSKISGCRDHALIMNERVIRKRFM